MNRTKLLLGFIIAIVYPTLTFAQQVIKPKFHKLIEATYEINGTGKNQVVNIKHYMEINENGLLHVKLVYYNGIADTTNQLSDSAITRLNKIFNGSKKLQSYMVTDKLPVNEHFGGDLRYISYTDNKNIPDNFIHVDPFMDSNFNSIVDLRIAFPKKPA